MNRMIEHRECPLCNQSNSLAKHLNDILLRLQKTIERNAFDHNACHPGIAILQYPNNLVVREFEL